MGERKVTILSYDCPGCGAAIKIDPDQKMANCEYCGTQFTIERETTPPQNQGYTANPNVGPSSTIRNNKVLKFLPLIIVGCIFMMAWVIPLVFGGIFALTGAFSDVRTEVAKIIEVDPFENIQVKVEGMEPWATISDVKTDTSLRVKYKVDQKSGLSNGDVVIIEAEEMAGYQWTHSTYEYTVSGLDTIVLDVSQLSDEDQELIYREAKKEIESQWERNLDYLDASLEDFHVDVKPYKMYINVCKDPSELFFYDKNIVYPAFETTFRIDGKNYTVYQYGEVHNVYLSPDGAMHGNFDFLDSSHGYIYSDSMGIKKSFSIWGFESILQMESAMEDENYRLIK